LTGGADLFSSKVNLFQLMDIVFNCPHCEQEMSVDSSGAGSEIQCPSCGEKITIPSASPALPDSVPVAPAGTGPSHAIASSAAAKVEMHLKVPVRDKPGEVLIAKPKAPLEAVVRSTDKKLRIRTIRRMHCIEAGHDKFDERVTEFLNAVGEANIISIHPVGYTHLDVGTQKILEDYGIVVVYRG
jgi:DNA-directed RNA polymerase subunit RPC12/RpoP